MDERKQKYIQSHLAEITQSWLGNVIILGAVLFLLLGIMDFVVARPHFTEFLVYRIVVALVLLGSYQLNKLRTHLLYQYAIALIGTACSAIAVELMILALGGHRSTYYAGLNLLIICLFGFVPLPFRAALLGVSIVYSIYLVPILVLDTITDVSVFTTHNAFMVATFLVALVWRALRQRSILNELSLQYDLAREKEKLERYSSHLEDQVIDRTKELHQSEQWHRSLFENATDGIVVLNRRGIIVNANQRACEMHGFSREALVGADIRLLEAEANKDRMADRMQRILAGEPLVFEAAHNRKDGSVIHIEVSAKAIAIGNEVFVQSFYRDITEKKKVQEHLFQSQKLESIGVLAGGVAHDFNNILTAILGYTEIIRKQIEGNEKVMRSLNVIESAARKSGRMISQLLDFSRKKSHETVPFSVNDVVQDTTRLLERVIGRNVSLSELLEGQLPPVRGDVNQIEQVLMNLIVNARDAMPNGGRILISTRAVEAGSGASDIPPFVKAGRYVLLTVTDTGTGIPPEIKDKIFEPFFTTKERGKGTGLGLSMAYGVVREHNGYITVQSELSRGTTFSIYLPAFDRASLPKIPAALPTFEGTETILVVDDEEAVLNFVRETLLIYGYRVVTAGSAMQALDIFRREHKRIDLVITDMAMPGMGGNELVQAMRSIDPGARILEISAYGKVIRPGERGLAGPDAFVQKPFETHALASAVRKILDTGPGTMINSTN